MARTQLHPEGGSNITLYIPTNVRDGMRQAAQQRRLSVSQLAARILGDYLRERGELPLREPVAQEA